MVSRLSKSTRVMLAFASVYLCWGSTYLAIHVAGEHLPVPVVSATRSLLSATLIGLICLLRGKSLRVPRDEMWKLVLVGLLFMSANNMLLIWGEKMVPSGFASLVISMVPILIALLETFLPSGDALNNHGWTGTLLGTVGIAVLVWPSLHARHVMFGYSRPLLGTFVLLGAALAMRFHFRADTFVATGWQIGAAGVFNASVALLSGSLHRAVWTWHGVGSIVYLSVFGSLFGLVAFTYLLQNVAVTKVATYAFVNPMIAVLLGVLILHERLAPAELAGMAVIVCAVAMVIYSRVDRGGSELAKEFVGDAGEAVE